MLLTLFSRSVLSVTDPHFSPFSLWPRREASHLGHKSKGKKSGPERNSDSVSTRRHLVNHELHLPVSLAFS